VAARLKFCGVARTTDSIGVAEPRNAFAPLTKGDLSSTERRVKVWRWVPVFMLAACGGSAPATVHPSPSTPGASKAKASDPPPPKEDEGRGGVQCDDGSCFACGEAICLSGFFCSVGKSGHGCAWLPNCSGRPSCGCIAPALREDPSCSCQEKEGGVYVTCDGARL
jgi:hypothetical protein